MKTDTTAPVPWAILRSCGILLGVFALGGCGKKVTQPANSTAPTACFVLSVQNQYCDYDSTYTLDASCSTDDATSPSDLQVRWDFDNDNNWDTAFGVVKTSSGYSPPEGDWTVRCEVRDGDGETTTATRMFRVGPYPAGPDLAVERIVFRDQLGNNVTSVGVGGAVSVVVMNRCIGSFDPYRFILSLNGVSWWDNQGGCSGGPRGCGGFGQEWIASAPGAFTFSVVLDADNAYQELNEGNNTASAILTVTP